MDDKIYLNQRWRQLSGGEQWVVLRYEGELVVLQAWNDLQNTWGNTFKKLEPLDLLLEMEPVEPLVIEVGFVGDEEVELWEL